MSVMKLIYDTTLNSPDLFYASKFNAPDPIIFFEFRTKKYLVLNDLEYDRALNESGVDKVLRLNDFINKNGKNSIENIINKIIKKMNPSEILVPYNFPSYIFQKIPKRIKKVVFDSNVFYKKRLIKTELEISNIKSVMRDTEKVMKEIVNIIKYSKVRNNNLIHNGKTLTSEFLINYCQRELLKYSLVCPDCIIASGADSSQPHNHGSGPIKPSSPIVIDIFPKSLVTGYYGDITRTFCKGSPSKELNNMYRAVLKGQKIGLKFLRSGVNGKSIHSKIEEEFNRLEFPTSYINNRASGFIHSTGHGLGLEIHEPPRISKNSEILKNNNVVTVEPGLYYPKIGGIRIEDTVVVKKTGIQNLTKFPKFFKL